MSCARDWEITSERMETVSPFMIFSGSHGREDELVRAIVCLSVFCAAACFRFGMLLLETVAWRLFRLFFFAAEFYLGVVGQNSGICSRLAGVVGQNSGVCSGLAGVVGQNSVPPLAPFGI